MWPDDRIHFAKKSIWGLFLIVLGGVLLLDRLGVWGFPQIGRFWPVVMFVFALIRLMEGRPGSALTLAGLGGWFLAAEFHWHGLAWETSWPLALVAVGLGIVVRALTGEDRRRSCCRPGVELD